MVGEIEAFGGMATAGLAASAIDGAGGHAGQSAANCANCDAALTGRFCANCGQSAHVHRTVGHLVEEFTHGILHVDTKAWRTLPRLVFQPGKLTREYIHGKRARYIAPLALFLFTIFLMFFVFGFLADSIDSNKVMQFDGAPVNVAGAQEKLNEAREELKNAQAQLAEAQSDPDAPPGLAGTFSGKVAATQAAVAIAEDSLKRARAAPAKVRKTPEKMTWQQRVQEFAKSDDSTVNLGSPELNKRVRHALENPDLALYKIEQKAYKLSFLLVPMSLPFLWLLFPFRRKVNMYDHTVFALYSLSFMSLLVIAFALTMQGPPWLASITSLLWFAVPLHMFAQLKGAYELGWLGALWRTFWLMIFSFVTLAIFLVGITVLGLID